MSIRSLLKPRQDNFVKLLLDQASLTLKGMELLKTYMDGHNPALAQEITVTEKEADEVRRILIEELLRTSITPIDREDIFALSRAIDDMIDFANTSVDEMEILGVRPTPHMSRIASLLCDAAHEIHLAVQCLKDQPRAASEQAQRAKTSANHVETVYREAVADLFSGPQSVERVMQVLKLREVYRHLCNAADRGEAAASVIADIVVKMT